MPTEDQGHVQNLDLFDCDPIRDRGAENIIPLPDGPTDFGNEERGVRGDSSHRHLKFDADECRAVDIKLKLVETATRLGGKVAGRAMWAQLGLPPMISASRPVSRSVALQSMDIVRQFLEDCTTQDPDGRVQAATLKYAYDAWARSNDAPRITVTAFGIVLSAIGIAKTRPAKVYYTGIRIVAATDALQDKGAAAPTSITTNNEGMVEPRSARSFRQS